jgi:transcriptional regulator with XRE-family HTH domain
MNKDSSLDLDRFAAAVKTRRGQSGLRTVAKEIGDISAPTLSRIEQGGVPDLDSFLRICHWLQQSPSEFTTGSSRKSNVETPRLIEAHLRADRILDPKVIVAISRMVELAYNAAKDKKV